MFYCLLDRFRIFHLCPYQTASPLVRGTKMSTLLDYSIIKVLKALNATDANVSNTILHKNNEIGALKPSLIGCNVDTETLSIEIHFMKTFLDY
jgi:hypothetical protein